MLISLVCAASLAACGGGSDADNSAASRSTHAQAVAAASARDAAAGIDLVQGPAPDLPQARTLVAAALPPTGPAAPLPTLATSALKVADGTGMVPLWPTSQDPIETTQFTLPDGTLVTRFGLVGRHRHARERGETWNEIGFGPNDTVDAQGNPVDKGPGNYLNFVKNYFKNRTWGVEIIDNSRV